MLTAAAVFVPVILVYTALIYRVLRGRVSGADVKRLELHGVLAYARELATPCPYRLADGEFAKILLRQRKIDINRVKRLKRHHWISLF